MGAVFIKNWHGNSGIQIYKNKTRFLNKSEVGFDVRNYNFTYLLYYLLLKVASIN